MSRFKWSVGPHERRLAPHGANYGCELVGAHLHEGDSDGRSAPSATTKKFERAHEPMSKPNARTVGRITVYSTGQEFVATTASMVPPSK